MKSNKLQHFAHFSLEIDLKISMIVEFRIQINKFSIQKFQFPIHTIHRHENEYKLTDVFRIVISYVSNSIMILIIRWWWFF